MHNNSTIRSAEFPQTTIWSVEDIDWNNEVLLWLKLLTVKFYFLSDTDRPLVFLPLDIVQ
jgi:hypothetical protein